MEALVKVNGGVRVSVNAHWSGVLNNGGSMGAKKKINEEGIGQGQ